MLELILGFMTKGFGGVSGPLTLGAIYAQHLSSIMEPLIALGYHVHLSSGIIFVDLL